MAQLKDLIVNGPTRLIGPAYGKITSADTVPVVNSNANLQFGQSTTIATIAGVAVNASLPNGGYQGPQGPNGTNGTNGKQGPQGPNGGNGTDGKQGPQGPKGGNGTDGTNGKQGPQGPKGTDATGTQGPQGPKGGNGTDGTNGKQGPQGPKGGSGTNGKQGPQGPKGTDATGTQGPQGPKGGNGTDGKQGPQGPKGGSGTNGKQGPQGPKGTDATGTQGPQGPKGTDGASVTPSTGTGKYYILSDTATTAALANASVKTHASVYMQNGNLYGTNVTATGNLYSDMILNRTGSENYTPVGAIGTAARAFNYLGTQQLIFGINTATTWYVGVGSGDGNWGWYNIYVNPTGKIISFSSAGTINARGHKIENIATPTNDSDAATKAYVDSQGGGSGSITATKQTNTTTSYYLLGTTLTATGTLSSANFNTGVYFKGTNLYATSDEKLKNFKGDIKVDFDKLATIPKKYFTWKADGPNGEVNIGTSAQKLEKVYPELVNTDENGNYAVSYDKLSVIALAAIDKLHEENLELKKEIEELKEEIKRLGLNNQIYG